MLIIMKSGRIFTEKRSNFTENGVYKFGDRFSYDENMFKYVKKAEIMSEIA